MSKESTISKWIAYVFLIILCLIWTIPLFFGFMTSFRSQTEIVSAGFRMLPVDWILENYIAILNKEAREAKKKRVFDRAFQTKIADEFYDELITYVEHLVARRELESATYSADLAPDYD